MQAYTDLNDMKKNKEHEDTKRTMNQSSTIISKEGATHEALPLGVTAKGQQRIYVDHHYVDRSQTIHEPRTIKEREALDYYHQGQIVGQFPLKLQTLLHKVEKLGMNHIFGWQPHGRSFTIRDPAEFESILMTRFFNQRQISSFRRQLNLYNFKRITRGPDAGSYYHEMFLRSKPLLAYKMTRMKVKGTKFRATSSPENEPDFYTMPYLETDCDASYSTSIPRAGAGSTENSSLCLCAGKECRNDGTARPYEATAVSAMGSAPLFALQPSALFAQGDTGDLLAYQEEINNPRRMEAMFPPGSLPSSLQYGLSPLSSYLPEDALLHLRHGVIAPSVSDVYNMHAYSYRGDHMQDASMMNSLWTGGV